MIKTIAVMTSASDSPGMNAAIRAVVRTALYEGVRVYGVHRGFQGLIDDDIVELERKSVGDIIQRGGTILGSARSEEFKTPEGRQKAYENLKKRGIMGLCIIGGDGTMRGAQVFTKEFDIAVVCLPGTVMNDIWGTDYTIGCDTAANTIIDAINKLRDTCSAHRRCAVLEVFGHKSGWLAMTAGISGGAEYILVPEFPHDIEKLTDEMKELYDKGQKKYILVVVAAGAGSAIEISKRVGQKTGIESRPLVLGPIQKGGSPSIIDRVNASRLGEKAALALISGLTNIYVGQNQGQIVNVSLDDAVTNKKTLDPRYLKLAETLV